MTQYTKLSSEVNTATLHRLATAHHLPDYVKQADISELTLQDRHKVAADAYAIADERIYPTHNKAATWVSYAMLRHRPDEGVGQDKLAAYILQRADLLGIKQDCLQIDTDINDFTKQAEETDEQFPVRNEKEAAAAAKFLGKELDNPTWTTLADRKHLGDKLAAFGIDSDAVRTARCEAGCYDAEVIKDKLRKLGNETDNDDTKRIIAETIRAVDSGSGGMQLQSVHSKLAALVDSLDVDLQTSPEKFVQSHPASKVVVMEDGSVIEKTAIENCELTCLQHQKIDNISDLTIGNAAGVRVKVAQEQLCREERQQLLSYIDNNQPSALYWRGSQSLTVVGL